MDRSRHVYLDIALTQRELDLLLGRLRSDTFGLDVFNQLADAIEAKATDSDPDVMMEVSFSSDAVRNTRDLCLACDVRQATENSAECEVCENREVIWNTERGCWELENV